ncbi:sodium/pantothenate symporter [Actinobacillus pleuropneumoniae]|uniref:Sodium/pantothenate symporter n=1 Tax=Actinobacillus pleuropneumoniae serotype 7 (strain AP76) TaxID=537457 RepID=B3H2Y6_ACTP7|nr:sodium/pantothenate symporter [Actinobacillus pleuropneumoniae]ACE62656.1 Sodium/pantothenate symporter [Actinobacillus pleuropneumoniae serovar 7 str. AP76]EFN01804.1 Sodium/pantothenate symporter [Actinobacillus pleuropneumoniae serovar 13 str. N273]MCL7725065.1 sodium/pantothenate symporter [Actinobacillus pleuropneumoniae]MCL7738481.1 sodium/pantothenate symporter [Actinobacillus pleuropneumoniae]UKH40056.1 sodium/pantothenate symporter [Actinobacillus pleuropneumoniae]
MNKEMLLPLIAYLCFVFGVAFYAYRKRQGGSFLSEYYVGSRSMSGFVLAMTTAATYVGASSFIGGPGAAYKYGLGWVLLAMIQVPAVLLALGALGKKFALLARQYNAVTINDLLLARYQNKFVVWISGFALLLSFFAMMTVQFIGAGRLLETTLGVPYQTAVIIFAITVGIYTFIGGFRAVVLTDTIQGLVMLVGTSLLLGGVIYAAGGVENAVNTLESINPQLIEPYGIDERPLDFTFMTSFWVLVCFGLIGLPQLAVRSMAYKDSASLHKALVIGTLVVSLLMFGMHLAGVLGRAVIPDLKIPDQVIPTLMIQVLPPLVAGIFLAAPMAAIMSSIDSLLIQSSSTLIKDLYLAVKPEAVNDEAKLKRFSTMTTLTFAVLLVFAALNPPDMLIWLNLLSLGGLEATFLWVIVLGLYWKNANAAGAISSMLAGLTSYVIFTSFKISIFSFHAIVPSLVIGLIAFLIGNRFGKKS